MRKEKSNRIEGRTLTNNDGKGFESGSSYQISKKQIE